MASDVETRAMAKCQAEGKWGYAQQWALRADGILTAQLPSWMARSWTITLGSFRYTGGPLSAIPPVTSNDPGTNNADTQTSQRTFARIDWGVDSGRETAYVDWPWGGCTFQVQAALVRVTQIGVTARNNTRLPLLNAFMAPVPNARGAIGQLGPTYTYGPIAQALGTTVVYPIPPRASAYRIIPDTAASAQLALIVNQMYGGVAFTGPLDWNSESITYAETNIHTWPQRALFVPLHPEMAAIQITTPGSGFGGWIQYLLDLG